MPDRLPFPKPLSKPVPKPVIARIVREGGSQLIDKAVARLLPDEPGGRLSLGGRIAGAALVRIASRSVPGAILIGGGLLARALHRQRKAARASAASRKPATGKPAK